MNFTKSAKFPYSQILSPWLGGYCRLWLQNHWWKKVARCSELEVYQMPHVPYRYLIHDTQLEQDLVGLSLYEQYILPCRIVSFPPAQPFWHEELWKKAERAGGASTTSVHYDCPSLTEGTYGDWEGVCSSTEFLVFCVFGGGGGGWT